MYFTFSWTQGILWDDQVLHLLLEGRPVPEAGLHVPSRHGGGRRQLHQGGHAARVSGGKTEGKHLRTYVCTYLCTL